MSRSNPTGEKPQSPCTRYFEWQAKKAQLSYYDKEKKETIPVKIPFAFLVLDELHTIKGYNKPKKKGYYSNEVHSLDKQKLKIYSKDGVEAEGLYEDIKGKVAGAKYHKSIYIAYYNDSKQLEIGCLLLGGTAMSEWFDFCKKKNVKKGAIRIDGTKEIADGDDVYYAPVFIQFDCKPETDAKATELDKVLQAYLTEYFAYSESFKPEQSKEEKDAIKASADHLEYARPKEESRGASKLEEESAPIVSSNSGLPVDFDEF